MFLQVPTCEEKPWDYENPSLKLGDYSYGYGPPTFSRVASYNTNDWSISVTGGFVSAVRFFTICSYRGMGQLVVVRGLMSFWG